MSDGQGGGGSPRRGRRKRRGSWEDKLGKNNRERVGESVGGAINTHPGGVAADEEGAPTGAARREAEPLGGEGNHRRAETGKGKDEKKKWAERKNHKEVGISGGS